MKNRSLNDWVGICGLREVDWDKGEGEYGIIIHPNYWRQRLSVEAHLAVIDHSFTRLKLKTIKFLTDASP